jgi:hypothetical protein
MEPAEYEALPATLTLRELRTQIRQPGCRVKELIVVSTLLDPAAYPAADLFDLYHERWQAELNLRSLKTVMQMEHLRCTAPHRVRNEFYMHLVPYNLIRKVMAIAAAQAGVEPWTVSFKGALQTLGRMLPLLATRVAIADWCDALLEAIAAHVVGDRPNRFEPRLRKRRPKPYKHLREPRGNYKTQRA